MIQNWEARVVTLIIRNLAGHVTRDDLQALFEPFGVVEGVDVVPGQDFCYVRMRNASDAHHAIRVLKVDGSHGNAIDISEARPFRYRTRVGSPPPRSR